MSVWSWVSSKASSVWTWANSCSRDDWRFGGEITVVVLTLGALTTSVVAAVASVEAARESRRAVDASLEDTRLQGAVPELVPGFYQVDGDKKRLFMGRTFNESGQAVITGLSIVNKGLAPTDATAILYPGDVTIDSATRELTLDPDKGIEGFEPCGYGGPVRLEPQFTTSITLTSDCKFSKEEQIFDDGTGLLHLSFGTGAGKDVYVVFLSNEECTTEGEVTSTCNSFGSRESSQDGQVDRATRQLRETPPLMR